MGSLYCSLFLVWVLIFKIYNASELIDVEDVTRMDTNESVNERIIQITAKSELDTRNVYFDDQPIPTYFDARNKWPDCKSIGRIYNQGSCKSGWAVAISSVITDRMCIQSNGTTQEVMSAFNLLSCCENCCGCKGGQILKGWEYAMKHGLLTGGGFNSKLGCQPYMIRPCDGRGNRWDDCSWKSDLVPRCSPARCSNIKYARIYKFGLKHRIENFVLFPRADPDVIMKEIYYNGPLQVSMHLYDDFRWYKGGVYRHDSGHFDGDHAVKLIGWDEHDNWLLINSFGTLWGNKGTFLISREHQLSNCDFGYAIIAPVLLS